MKARPVAVAIFPERGEPLIKVLGRAVDGNLDCIPYASLFPGHAHLAWLFAEWADWLEATVKEERVSLSDLCERLNGPTIAAVRAAKLRKATGNFATLLGREFTRRVTWPAALPPTALGGLFDELLTFFAAQLAEERGRRLLVTRERGRWNLLIHGRLSGLVAVKPARPGVSPVRRAESIRRALSDGSVADRKLVITNAPAVAAQLRTAGFDAIALGEKDYVKMLMAWFAAIG